MLFEMMGKEFSREAKGMNFRVFTKHWYDISYSFQGSNLQTKRKMLISKL